MSEQRPFTFDGADVAEFLDFVEPSVIDIERIVRAVCRASCGAPRARLLIHRFVRWYSGFCCLGRPMPNWRYVDLLEDPDDPDLLESVDVWWDEVAAWWRAEADGDGNEEPIPAEDLRDLARKQAAFFRDQADEVRLSQNHPEVVRELCSRDEGIAAWAEHWAGRPRRDVFTICEAEDAALRDAPKWPKLIAYENKRGSKHARLFLKVRPWPCLSSDGVLYSFRNGAWRETADAEMEAEVRATDPEDQLDVEHVTKIVRGVHHLSSTSAKPFEWIDPQGDEPAPDDLALFRNGLLDVDTGTLIPHDGRYFATGLPDHDYDPFAECPAWMAWLDETLDPAFHPTLQQWFGYCLTPDVRAHRFMTFLGGPRSGKSTAHGVLHGLVGAQHAASVMMPDLGGDFGLEGLADKRLAVVPDAHDAPTRNRAAALERIKSITGGDEVSVNRKNRSIVPATLRARLLVTCNRLPKFIDESGALAARMLIIRFDRSFIGREDRAMGERLRAEMSGIANWALEGLSRLRSEGLRFTVSDAGRAEADLAARSQSPALRFAQDRLEVTGGSGDFTPLRDIHRVYGEWIAEEGAQRSEVRSQNDLAQDLTAAIPSLSISQRRIEGRRTYGLVGVRSARSDLDEA